MDSSPACSPRRSRRGQAAIRARSTARSLTNSASRVYDRVEAPATPAEKAVLAKLSPGQIKLTELAGEKIQAILTRAPGNDAPIGGLKAVTESGWFAARPSGTEDIYKIYAESFRGDSQLRQILEEAQTIVSATLAAGSGAGGSRPAEPFPPPSTDGKRSGRSWAQ